ncbi:MAG: hypothetical protein O3A00_10795 [Planctomycetota bacterium]|nr:hypothetical protein [Planctomycetota bacterium]
MIAIGGKVEFSDGSVSRATVLRKDRPSRLALLLGVEEFELRVRDPPKFGIGFGTLKTVPVSDDLDQGFTVVDAFPQRVADFAGLGAEDLLPIGFIAFAAEHVGHHLPSGSQLGGNSRDKDARFHQSFDGSGGSKFNARGGSRPLL